MCVEGLVGLFIVIPAHRTYCIVYAYSEEPEVPSDIIGDQR